MKHEDEETWDDEYMVSNSYGWGKNSPEDLKSRVLR